MDVEKHNSQLKILLDPDTVYHYTSSKVAMEHILKDKKLRLSPYTRTNDPMDYDYMYFGVSLWGEKGDLEKNTILVSKYLKDYTRDYLRFVSFCRNRKYPDSIDTESLYNLDFLNMPSNKLGWFRPRMWSQYGEGHQGIRIAFSLSELEKELELHGERKKEFFSDEVDYFDFPVIPQNELLLDGKKIAEMGVEVFAKEYIKTKWKALLFRKHKDYRDEIEQRIILRTKNENEDYLFLDISKPIKAIILGDKFNSTYYPVVKKQSKELNIFTQKLHWRNGEFWLFNGKLD